TGLPRIFEMSLQTLNSQWLPVDDVFDLQLIDQLVRTGRSFIKCLRYNLRRNDHLVNVTLLDAEDAPIAMLILPDAAPNSDWSSGQRPPWIWRPSLEPMPSLPH